MSFAKMNDVCTEYTFCEMASTVFTQSSVMGQGFCLAPSPSPSPRASPRGPAQGLGKWVAGKGPATLGVVVVGRLGSRLPEQLTKGRSDNGKHSSPPPPTPAFLSSSQSPPRECTAGFSLDFFF